MDSGSLSSLTPEELVSRVQQAEQLVSLAFYYSPLFTGMLQPTSFMYSAENLCRLDQGIGRHAVHTVVLILFVCDCDASSTGSAGAETQQQSQRRVESCKDAECARGGYPLCDSAVFAPQNTAL